MLIHDQKDPPVADTHGMFIGPGMAASIAIRKQKVRARYMVNKPVRSALAQFTNSFTTSLQIKSFSYLFVK